MCYWYFLIFLNILDFFYIFGTSIITWIVVIKIYPKNYSTIQSIMGIVNNLDYVLFDNLVFKEGLYYLWGSLFLHITLLLLKLLCHHFINKSNFVKSNIPPPSYIDSVISCSA